MVVRRVAITDAVYNDILLLRYDLFFKAYGLPFSVVQDELEGESEHYAIVKDDCLYAYGRVSEISPSEYKVSQVLVAPEFRGCGYGSYMLDHIVSTLMTRSGASVYLNARLSAERFYATVGFRRSGVPFLSRVTNVPHVRMDYYAS